MYYIILTQMLIAGSSNHHRRPLRPPPARPPRRSPAPVLARDVSEVTSSEEAEAGDPRLLEVPGISIISTHNIYYLVEFLNFDVDTTINVYIQYLIFEEWMFVVCLSPHKIGTLKDFH